MLIHRVPRLDPRRAASRSPSRAAASRSSTKQSRSRRAGPGSGISQIPVSSPAGCTSQLLSASARASLHLPFPPQARTPTTCEPARHSLKQTPPSQLDRSRETTTYIKVRNLPALGRRANGPRTDPRTESRIKSRVPGFRTILGTADCSLLASCSTALDSPARKSANIARARGPPIWGSFRSCTIF